MGFPSSSGTMSAVMEQLSMIDKAFAASSSAAIILGFLVMTFRRVLTDPAREHEGV